MKVQKEVETLSDHKYHVLRLAQKVIVKRGRKTADETLRGRTGRQAFNKHLEIQTGPTADADSEAVEWNRKLTRIVPKLRGGTGGGAQWWGTDLEQARRN